MENYTECRFESHLVYLHNKYITGKGEVPDVEFDNMVEYFENKFNISWKDIRDSLNEEGIMVKLPFYLPSLDTFKTEKIVTKKIKSFNYDPPYVVMDKMDGTSLAYTGKKMYTSGTKGEKGKNVSHVIKYLNLPDITGISGVGVRGEFVILDVDFKGYVQIRRRQGTKNLLDSMRSTVNGIINSKEADLDRDAIAICIFIAFKIIGSPKTKLEQLKELEDFNFSVCWYQELSYIDYYVLEHILNLRRGGGALEYKAPYDIDGLVIEANVVENRIDTSTKNPDYAFAFKIDRHTIAYIKDVEWNLSSKDGFIKPTIILEGIRFLGKNMNRSTGWNAAQVINKGLGRGAKVLVTFANDVTPHIAEVLEPATAENMILPDIDEDLYEFNKSGVDFVLKNVEENPFVEVQKLIFFFKTLEVKNIGPVVVNTLYSAGFDTLSKIFNMTVDDIKGLPRFGTLSATKYINHIHNAINDADLATIMAASCVFGRNIGVIKLNSILDRYPNLLDMYDDSELYNKLSQIRGIGELVIAYRVSDRLVDFIEWLEEHPEITIKTTKDQIEIDDKFDELRGKEVCFTGGDYKLPNGESLKKLLENNGVIVKKSFVNTLTLLIVTKSTGKPSNKIKSATDKNIDVVTIDDFLEAFEII